MRDIKFKVWDKIESLMFDKVEYIGFSDKVVHLKTHNLCDDEELMNFNGNRWQDKCGGFNDIDFTEIELMQYTGIKDKNGVEIYEGDIVKYKDYDDYLYKVVFVKNECRFFAVGVTETQSENYLGYKINNKLKVIGNIYETPNLLRDI